MSQSLLQQAVDDLTRDIMNMQHKCPDDCMTPTERMGYSAGHRDARHAAVELVNAALAAIQQQPEPVAWRHRFYKGSPPAGWSNWIYTDSKPTREFAEVEPLYSAPALQQQEVPSGWIDVSERVPEPGTECLVWAHPRWSKRPFVAVDTWDEQRECPVAWSTASIPIGLGWDAHEFEEVTHWMPVPSSPSTTRQQEVGTDGGEDSHA